MHPLVQEHIRKAQVALWRAELMRCGLFLTCIVLAAILAWLLTDQWLVPLGALGRTLAMLVMLIGTMVFFWRTVVPLLQSQIAEDYAARSLERDHPELGHRLSSYVALQRQLVLADGTWAPSAEATADQHTAPNTRQHLSDRILRSVGADIAGRLQQLESPPSEAAGLLRWWIATLTLFTALVAYSVASPKNSLQSVARLIAPLASIERPCRVTIDGVTPGDHEVLGGRTFWISAHVHGLRPGELVECRLLNGNGIGPVDPSVITPTDTTRYDNAASSAHIRCRMHAAKDASTRQPTFELQLRVDTTAVGKRRYRIFAGDASSREFTLTIRDAPVVTLERVEITPPRYTREPASVSSSGAIRAIDGSLVTLQGRFNTAIQRGSLEFNPRLIGQTIRATAGVRDLELDANGMGFRHSFRLQTRSRGDGAVQIDSYRLRIWDENDATNPEPVVYPIEILPDLPPEIVIVTPRQNPKDLPLDMGQVLEIHATDPDFGLSHLELVFRRGIDVIARTSLLDEPEGAIGPQVLRDSFRPSRTLLIPDSRNRSTRLIPGDEIEITAIATDNRLIPDQPQVQPNVTRSDPIMIRIVAPENPPSDETRRESQNRGGGQNEQPNPNGNSQSGGNSGGAGDAGAAQQSGESQGKSGGGQGNGADEASQPNAESESDNTGSGKGGDAGPENGDQESNERNEGQGGTPSTPGQDSSPSGTDTQSNDNASGNGNAGGRAQSDATDGMPADPSQQGETSGGSGVDPGDGERDERGDAGQKQQAPSNDGEAFERIRDFLEQQERNKQGSESKPGDASSNGESSTDNGQTKPASSQQEGAGQTSDTSGETEGANTPTNSDSRDNGSGPKPQQERSENGENRSDGQRDRDAASNDNRSQNSQEQNGDAGTGESSKRESDRSDSQRPTGTDNEPGQDQQGSDPGQSQPSGMENGSPTGSEGSEDSAVQQTDRGQGEQKSGKGNESSDAGDATPETSGNGSESAPGQPSASSSEDQENSGTQPQAGNNNDLLAPEQNDSGSSTGGGLGSSGSGMGQETDANDAPTPEPVDMEYTRQATDMVLDYLDQTRETPDPDLLDRLNWDAKTLERFRQRWANAPGIDDARDGTGESSPEILEALRSLGMRPPTQSVGSTRSRGADSASGSGLNDTGNRQPAPSSLRDAFEAFRRQVR
ncbi:MAG: hypothetical protein AAGD07_04495 [Planctomycetota bacterium]